MEQINILLLGLSKISNNLKKNPNRRYQKTTLIEKLNASKTIYNEILELCETLEDDRQKFILNSGRLLFDEIKTFIDIRLERTQLITFKALAIAVVNFNKLYKKIKMATVDIKLGTTLVPTYDGTPDLLDAFVDAVDLFKDIVDQAFAAATPEQKVAAETTVARFVRTRLTGKARQSINENQTINEMLNSIKVSCISKVTADSLISKLRTIKQNGSLSDFCDKIDKICSQIKSVYLKDGIPQQTASKMSTKCGIDALIQGAKNNEAKIILKAGTFHSLNEAVQKFQESESATTASTASSQIYYGYTNRGNQSRGRGNFQRGNRGRGGNNYRQYDPQNFQRGNFNNNRYHRGNRYPRGNQNQRGNYRPNMFVTQQSQQPFQQQIQNLQYQMQQQHLQQPQQHFQQPPSNNIHPLGVPLGQHTQ